MRYPTHVNIFPNDRLEENKKKIAITLIENNMQFSFYEHYFTISSYDQEKIYRILDQLKELAHCP